MNKHKSLISIGIPAYNEEANIKSLLHNILNQKAELYKLEEIIIISDGSTDSTIENIHSVKNNKIKLIDGNIRMGQNYRLNQIIETKSKKSNYLLVLEADQIPADNRFIDKIISKIPEDKKFSVIMSNLTPAKAEGFFEKVVYFGYFYRKEIFEKTNDNLNLYLSTSAKLLSKEFLKSFRWDNNFHEDSYCFRKALESRLPIIRATDAKIYFKSVSNLHDYLLQSGKFQKARSKENKIAGTYKLNVNYFKLINITFKYLFKNPFYLTNYILLLILSRLYSLFLPEYHIFWDVYKSSKVFTQKN